MLQEAYRVTRLHLAVLEWLYAEQNFGPGLDERLQPKQVMQLAGQAGYRYLPARAVHALPF